MIIKLGRYNEIGELLIIEPQGRRNMYAIGMETGGYL